MNIKSILSKSIIVSVAITTIFWISFFELFNFYENKRPEGKLSSEQVSVNEDEKPEKIYEKGNIALYKGEPLKQYQASVLLKKSEDNQYEMVNDQISFYGYDTLTYSTDIPNIILYTAGFGDMGARTYDELYINTDDSRTIEVNSGNGFNINNYAIHINDDINSSGRSIIQASVNDQCGDDNIKKAWVKDLMINGYPQNIFNKEYEIQCVEVLGDLVYLDTEGINKDLDKIFFTYTAFKPDDTEIKESYSYNLKTHKIILEQPNNLLKKYAGQYLTPDENSNGNILMIKNDKE